MKNLTPNLEFDEQKLDTPASIYAYKNFKC